MSEIDLRTQQAIDNFLDELASRISDIIGVSEVITGCAITNVDTYATGVMPRYITARVNEFTEPNILWRGVPPSLTVGMEVSVLHLREGNRYEVLGASGAGGITSSLELYNENPPPATPPAATGLVSVAIGDGAMAGGDYASTGGGLDPDASGDYARVGGGDNNEASGDYAVVDGGLDNLASGWGAAVVGGQGNIANNNTAFVGAGAANLASGDSSAIPGGASNVASANYTFAAGYNNEASGNYASVPGGSDAIANKHGQQSQAAGYLFNPGDVQRSSLIGREVTGNATPLEVFLDGGWERCTIADSSAWLFHVHVLAYNYTVAGVYGGWDFVGIIAHRGGTCSIINVVNQPYVYKGNAGLDAVVDADNVNKALRVTVTGIAAQTVMWAVHIELLELNEMP